MRLVDVPNVKQVTRQQPVSVCYLRYGGTVKKRKHMHANVTINATDIWHRSVKTTPKCTRNLLHSGHRTRYQQCSVLTEG